MKNDTTIVIRIPQEVKDKLQKLADADNRTLSNYIQLLLTKHTSK